MHPSDGHVQALIDGELDPPRAARVLAHLESCATCRDRRRALEFGLDETAHLLESLDRSPGSFRSQSSLAQLELVSGDLDRAVALYRKLVARSDGLRELSNLGVAYMLARRNQEEIPPELSNLAGGEIATEPDEETGGAVPLTTVYEAIIPIDNADLALHPGQRGMAKIDGGTATLGWWLWRTITKTFRFVL